MLVRTIRIAYSNPSVDGAAQRFEVDVVELVPPLTPADHQPGLFEHVEMLRHGLPGGTQRVPHGQPATYLEQRLPAALTQLVHDRAAGGIGEGPKHVSHPVHDRQEITCLSIAAEAGRRPRPCVSRARRV